MSARVVTWEPGMESLGAAVVAIGVFDGVHLGHQALLTATVSESRRLRARAVALTFDRDPDQVVTPSAAAPQLLTLADKCRFIGECGVDTVVVVPFTAQLASTPADAFLDQVLGECCEVRSIHVGHDFRFGAKAAGDIETLYLWAAEHGAEARPHDLVEVDGAPVTSTRIRTLVSAGDVAAARLLLGRPPRVSGRVHEGRRQGSELGFPTANVVPVPFAALPADGVYAGAVHLPDGAVHPSAISVGVPPTFPEAHDYLEVHLIGFDGDLYETDLTVEFVECLRDQQAFRSGEELTDAIAADVAAASERMARHLRSTSGEDGLSPDEYATDDELVDDPEALAAAEGAVAHTDPLDVFDQTSEDWVELLPPARLSGLWATAGVSAMTIVLPLQAEGIPYAWDPFPPEQSSSFRPFYGGLDRSFALVVPRSERFRALNALGLEDEPAAEEPAPRRPIDFLPVAPPAPGPIVTEGEGMRRVLIAVFVVLFFLFVLGIAVPFIP